VVRINGQSIKESDESGEIRMEIKTAIKSIVGAVRTIENWPTFLSKYFAIMGQGNVTYRFRNGIRLKMRGSESDVVIVEGIWIHKFYNPEGFEINDGDIVVDIGSHVGVFSIFASLNNKKGKILAFEPISRNFDIINYNIKINKIKNITPIKKAVAATDGKKKMFLGFVDSTSSFKKSKYVKNDFINVQTITLKSIFNQYHIKQIDFLKMDCEGEEYEILFKCPDSIFKKIKKISLECHNIDSKWNLNSLKKFLERKGFEVEVRQPIQKLTNMVYAKQQ